MKTKGFKYNVINKNGNQEPWTGIFKNSKLADAWYEKHGKIHEQEGHKLIRVECASKERD